MAQGLTDPVDEEVLDRMGKALREQAEVGTRDLVLALTAISDHVAVDQLTVPQREAVDRLREVAATKLVRKPLPAAPEPPQAGPPPARPVNRA